MALWLTRLFGNKLKYLKIRLSHNAPAAEVQRFRLKPVFIST